MFTSSLIGSITAFRNPNGSEYNWTRLDPEERKSPNILKVALAEAAYIAVIPLAIIETALSGIATLLDYVIFRPSSIPFTAIWLGCSAFSIGWAVANILLNPFCNDMIENGANARLCFLEGRLLAAPKQLAGPELILP